MLGGAGKSFRPRNFGTTIEVDRWLLGVCEKGRSE
jgi:hypothetical protein